MYDYTWENKISGARDTAYVLAKERTDELHRMMKECDSSIRMESVTVNGITLHGAIAKSIAYTVHEKLKAEHFRLYKYMQDMKFNMDTWMEELCNQAKAQDAHDG